MGQPASFQDQSGILFRSSIKRGIMSRNVRVFTRRELFDLVWSKPMQKLAEELGISDRGLAKICSRHRVPNPSRGYWARVAAGQKIRPTLYREVDDSSLNRIEITATVSEEAREILVKAKADRVERRQTTSSNPVASLLPVEKPHRTVTLTARELRKSKSNQYGGIFATGTGMCGVIVHVDHAERVIAFLHSLATALEAVGLQLQPDDTRMKISVGPDQVVFTLTERTRRVKHIPTKEEQALYDRQQTKRQRAADRQNWDLYMSLPHEKPWPEFDTVYTGQLVFQIEGWAQGLRKTWADGKTQSVESMFGDILAGLKIILAYEKSERERREQEALQRAELARRWELVKKRKDREEHRIAHLQELMRLRREALDIKSWLASLPEGIMTDSSTELSRMLLWAKERLDNLEAKTTIEAMTVQLEGKSLFPEVDELHDPLGDPSEPRYW
jgi:hypothetical protein